MLRLCIAVCCGYSLRLARWWCNTPLFRRIIYEGQFAVTSDSGVAFVFVCKGFQLGIPSSRPNSYPIVFNQNRMINIPSQQSSFRPAICYRCLCIAYRGWRVRDGCEARYLCEIDWTRDSYTTDKHGIETEASGTATWQAAGCHKDLSEIGLLIIPPMH